MSVHSIHDLEKINESKIREIDARVIKDLEKFVDGRVRMRKIEFETDVAVWKSALLIFHSGSFSKGVQNRLAEILGDEILESVKSFFELYSRDKLLDEISRRLDETLASATKEFPSVAEDIKSVGFEKARRIVEGDEEK